MSRLGSACRRNRRRSGGCSRWEQGQETPPLPPAHPIIKQGETPGNKIGVPDQSSK